MPQKPRVLLIADSEATVEGTVGFKPNAGNRPWKTEAESGRGWWTPFIVYPDGCGKILVVGLCKASDILSSRPHPVPVAQRRMPTLMIVKTAQSVNP